MRSKRGGGGGGGGGGGVGGGGGGGGWGIVSDVRFTVGESNRLLLSPK